MGHRNLLRCDIYLLRCDIYLLRCDFYFLRCVFYSVADPCGPPYETSQCPATTKPHLSADPD